MSRAVDCIERVTSHPVTRAGLTAGAVGGAMIAAVEAGNPAPVDAQAAPTRTPTPRSITMTLTPVEQCLARLGIRAQVLRNGTPIGTAPNREYTVRSATEIGRLVTDGSGIGRDPKTEKDYLEFVGRSDDVKNGKPAIKLNVLSSNGQSEDTLVACGTINRLDKNIDDPKGVVTPGASPTFKPQGTVLPETPAAGTPVATPTPRRTALATLTATVRAIATGTGTPRPEATATTTPPALAARTPTPTEPPASPSATSRPSPTETRVSLPIATPTVTPSREGSIPVLSGLGDAAGAVGGAIGGFLGGVAGAVTENPLKSAGILGGLGYGLARIIRKGKPPIFAIHGLKII